MTTSALATLSPEKPTKPTNPDIMQNEFANRQNMHLTVLKLLDSPEYQGAWKNQKPTAFTTRAAELRPLVNSLTDLIAAQQTATTGYAETKEREEQELETLAHEIGQTLADWHEENGRDGEAAQIDLSLSAWQRLRDTDLLAKMDRLVLRFRKTDAGTRFADTWQATRIIRDLGEAAPPAPPAA